MTTVRGRDHAFERCGLENRVIGSVAAESARVSRSFARATDERGTIRRRVRFVEKVNHATCGYPGPAMGRSPGGSGPFYVFEAQAPRLDNGAAHG
jgi:hypothetical protein